MRRVVRILLNALTVLSLVLALLVAGLWVRSCQISDEFWRGAGYTCPTADGWSHHRVSTFRGGIWYLRDFYREPVDEPHDPLHDVDDVESFSWEPRPSSRYYTNMLDPPNVANRVGFGFRQWTLHHEGDWGRSETWSIAIPFWPATLPGAVTAAVWLRRRWRRIPTVGGCTTCGYDLRGTPGRCPECGAAPAGPRAG